MPIRLMVALLSTTIVGLSFAVTMAQTKTPESVLREHSGAVRGVAVSPDGKRVASVGDDNSVRLWDLEKRTAAGSLPGHEAPVLSVAFSADGKRLVSGDKTGSVIVWDVASGKKAYSVQAQKSPATSVAFSRSGKFLFTAGGGPVVQVWDAAKGDPDRRRIAANLGDVASLAISGDGKQIAIGNTGLPGKPGGQIKVVDLANGREVVTLGGGPGTITSIAFSPDGSRMACGSGADASNAGEVWVWDADEPSSPDILKGHDGDVCSVAFSPDGKRLVSAGSDKVVRVWDSVNGTLIGTFAGHQESIHSVAFTPNGRSIVSGSSDRSVRIWDVDKATRAPATGGKSAGTLAEALASIPPRARSYVMFNNSRIDAAPPASTPIVTMPNLGGGSEVVFSGDGRRISVGGLRVVKRFDADHGTELRSFNGQNQYVSSFVALNSEGTRCANAGADGTVRIWDVEQGGELHALKDGKTKDFAGVAFSPDGKRVAAVANGKDLIVIVWDATSGILLKTLKLDGAEGRSTRVAFSPDGKLLAANYFTSTAGVLVVWELGMDAPPRILTGHQNMVTSLAFSPDGKRIVSTAWGTPGEVRVWDVATGSLLRKLTGHKSPVNSASFSADGKKVVSSGSDNFLKVWDVEKGTEIGSINGPEQGGVIGAAFSPDGKRIASTNGTNAYVWSVDQAKPIPAKAEAAKVAAAPQNHRGGVTIKGSPGSMNALRKFQEEAAAKQGITLPPGDGPVVIENGKMRTANTRATGNDRPAAPSGAAKPSGKNGPKPGGSAPESNAKVAADATPMDRALAGDWTRSLIAFNRELREKPIENGETGFEYAAVALLAGDETRYRTICADLFERSGTLAIRPFHVARACTLAPNGIKDLATLQEKADAELKGSNAPWALTQNGAIAYRAGRFDDSANFFEQSLKADARPGGAVVNWLWLSMVESRRGHKKEALEWLTKATEWMDETAKGSSAYRKNVDREVDGLHHHNWFEALILRKEAKALSGENRRAERSSTRNGRPGSTASNSPARSRRLVLIPTAENDQAASWRYTTTDPGQDWQVVNFNASRWAVGKAGFCSPGQLALRGNTLWQSKDLWLRTTVEIPKSKANNRFVLRVGHDDGLVIYVNGVVIYEFAKASGSPSGAYREVILDEEKAALFREGANIVAAQCTDTGGECGVDIGLAMIPMD